MTGEKTELSAAKKMLLEKRLQGALRNTVREPAISRRENGGSAPLSFAQQRLWFLDQLEPGSAVYNVIEALHLDGLLDVEALERSFGEIVRRHEVLRTNFISTDGQAAQVVAPAAEFKINAIDLRVLSPLEREQESRRIVNEEARRPFDLARDLMLRVTLVKLTPTEHVLILTMHHIASDAWSIGVLYQELSKLYEGFAQNKPATLPELPIQYPDFAVWQRDWMRGNRLERELEHWKGQLAGAPELLNLPTDRPRPTRQTFRGSHRAVALSCEISRKLRDLSQQQGTTLYVTLLTAFTALLHRYTRQDDVVVGSPIAGRTRSETEGLIGFFVNTLALWTRVNPQMTFTEVLGEVRKVTLAAYAHQELPFDKMVEYLHPQRSLSVTPFVQTMFVVQKGLSDDLRLPGITATAMDVENGTSKFDLMLTVLDQEPQLSAAIEYNTDLYDAATIDRMLSHYAMLLEGVTRNPTQRVSELPLLSEGERHQLLVEWNNTTAKFPRDASVYRLFEAQAQQTPTARAITDGAKHLTYEQLNERANRMARHLQSAGVVAGSFVGVFLERSADLVVTLLGILKAGGAYVPFDQSYPKERIAFMLEDAQVQVLVTESRFASMLPEQASTNCVYLDRDREQIAGEDGRNLVMEVGGDAPTYVIYTSGSTGKPKGVVVPHRAISRLVINTNYVQLTPRDVVAQVSNSSFDAATWEIWGSLLNGGRLVIIAKETVLSAADFAAAIREHGATAMFLTTALFNQHVSQHPAMFKGVGHVMIGGEALDPGSIRDCLQHGAPQNLWNIYGPTETTTFAVCRRIGEIPEGATSIPIGRPISNTTLYVLDEQRQPVPTGVAGELYIGGDGVALGYLNRPELTQERFIDDPFSNDPAAKLYRTGDLVRYLNSGAVDFLGRMDQQVKVRGFRIELGEIEAVLGEHPSIRQCTVAAWSEASGAKRLHAYVVPSNGSVSVAELRGFLEERLPDYMVPSSFVTIPAVPLSPNGKVNRAALPRPETVRQPTSELRAVPQDELEKGLLKVWQEVLGAKELGTTDNFFELGGHSLMAVRLAAQVEKMFGKKLSVASIFQHPTIQKLASLLRDGQIVGPSSSIVEIQPKGNRPPIFFVHGVGGGMFWGYTNLARHLGEEQPVYGFRSRGTDGRPELESIEDMAAQYVADLRAFQSQGPYYLGGYCFGGNVAYEMARILQQQGEKVAMLALINAGPPNSSYTQVRWTPRFALKFCRNLIYWTRYATTWSTKQRKDFVRWKLTVLNKAIRRRLGLAEQEADVGNWVDLEAYPESERPLWEAHIRCLVQYKPGPYHGKVTLFRSPGHPFLCSFDSRYGWGEFAMDGVEVHVVSGYHESILEEPYVQHLATEMSRVLRTAHAAQQPPRVEQPPPPTARAEPQPDPVRRPDRVEAPLAIAQKALWELGAGEANVSIALELESSLDVEALKRSLREIVERHAVLRTRFVNNGSMMQQSIDALAEVRLERVQAAQTGDVERQVEAAATRRFDLATAPVLRAVLFDIAPERYRLLLVMPALSADEVSLEILQRELTELYNARKMGRPAELPVLPVQYADYAAWENENIKAAQQMPHAREHSDAPAPEIPTDRPLPARRSWRARVETLMLPKGLLQALKRVGHREAITLFLTIVAASGTVLYRHTRQESFSVSTVMSGRMRNDIRNLIGLLSNISVVRADFSENPTFNEVAQRFRQALGGSSPGFVKDGLRVLVTLDSKLDALPPWSGLGVTQLPLQSKLVPFDLGLRFVESAHDLLIECTYNADVFEAVSMQRLLARTQHALEAVAANPDMRVSDVPILPDAERRQILEHWNATDVEFPLDQSYTNLFEAQAATAPDAVAVRFASQEWTYAELNRRANQIAHHLRDIGIGPESLVGICMERSLDIAASVLGVLKAGGGYLPIDPDYPQERIDYMISDSRTPVLLSQKQLLPRLTEHSIPKLIVDDPEFRAQVERPGWESNPVRTAAPSNLAYVIYTSGSTGKSKGVEVTRRSLLNHSLAVARAFRLRLEDRVLQFTALSFDVSIEEMLPSWLNGCAVVMRTEEVLASIAQFFKFVEAEKITVLNLPTAFWHAVVEALPMLTIPRSVRLVVIGGEKPSLQHYHAWKEHVGERVQLMNAYGLTETTITNTVYETAADAPLHTLPIGRPIANTHTYILDSLFQPVPIGMAGELYIGGEGVARGYLNRPELTAERFFVNPFGGHSARLYKTGDLARFLPDGNIEFVGRLDDQIKLRGFRIEAGEVEAALAEHPAISRAVVAARVYGASSEKRLLAWFVPAAQQTPSTGELIEFLKGKLPEHMIPSAFVTVPSLPLMPNGKVDRAALPDPSSVRPNLQQPWVAPSTPLEKQLANIWGEVLGIENVGLHDNFFDLGGHSIHLMQGIARIRERVTNADVPLDKLFHATTIAALATLLAGGRRRPGSVPGPIAPCERNGSAALSFAQQRLWFLHQLDPNSPAYNLVHRITIKGTLDSQALESALRAVVARHEALRTRFVDVDGEARQHVVSADEFKLCMADPTHRGALSREELQRIVAEEATTAFDLSRDFLVRARLLRLSQAEHVLLITFHHIACDGWSIEIFWDELFSAYDSLTTASASQLGPLPIQYIDYAQWQREWLQGEVIEEQLNFWKSQLAGAPALLELPTDRPRPAALSDVGRRHPVRFSPLLTAGLKSLSQQENCTLFMTVLAGFNALLARYTGRNDVVVGTVVANRTRAELEPLIGFFANTLVLRSDLSGDPTFQETLDRTRSVTLGAYAHQDLPFEKLVEHLHPVRNRSHHPLFQVMLVLQNVPASQRKGSLEADIAEVDTGTTLFDLMLNLTEEGETIGGYLQYSSDLFDEATIARMVNHLTTLLESAVRFPDTPLSRLRMLGEEEREQLLVGWNATAIDYPKELTWMELFEGQVARTPEATALVFGKQRLSYAELNRRTNQLAHHLRGLGVGAESLVGICAERSVEMVVAILAVLKAGGAYLPMDPAYPAERLGFMLEDAQVSVLITQSSIQRKWPQNTRVLQLDALTLDKESAENPSHLSKPESLAYVIYTSGSTGRPKGVAIEHRSLNAFAHWAKERYTPEELDGVLAGTSICFDLSVFELLVPVCWGGKIVLARNVLELPEIKEPVRLINTVPSAATELVRLKAIPASVQVINLAGEPLRQSLVDEFYELGTVKKVYDLYGPTEDTVYSTCALREPRGRTTIGRPLPNKQVYILDEQMEPVPVGVVGQLYIGGDGLARGYLQRPELTSERFMASPWDGRIYKTGDLARYQWDGQIDFLGRADHQVKIRGFRIELGEVEAQLRQHERVREAVVVAREDGGEKRLVGYVVGEGSLAVSELKDHVRKRLPDYMVPAALVLLDKLPLTPNGKIDRKALPEPEATSAHGEELAEPQTDIEELLAGIWREVLGVPRLGIRDNFFELGGHSLMVTKLISRVRDSIQVELPMASVFEAPTIAELALVIEDILIREIDGLSNEQTEKVDQLEVAR